MRRVSIRDLSGELIASATAAGEFLGVTNNGSLAGVLVPLAPEILRRLAISDADHTLAAVRRAEADAAAGFAPTALADLLRHPGPRAPSGAGGGFARISIRELSGGRLEQASAAGEPLVVTSGRVALAVLLPVMSTWVERLVEESVTRFLDTPDAPTVQPSPAGPAHPLRGRSSERFLHQKAIGIRIIGDAPDDRKRLVGVVTNMSAEIDYGPVELALPDLQEHLVFGRILELVDLLQEQIPDTDDVIGVGVEIGGHVHEGRVVYSANARWDHFPLADRLSETLRLPVILENDANALAVYERAFRGVDDDHFAVILLTNLGVGCGLVLGGELYRGSRGVAGELGHVSVDFDKTEVVKCRCMNPGCLEGVATPRAIELTLRAHGFQGDYDEALHAADNKVVRRVFEEAGAGLGRAVSAVLNLVNPSTVVFYGPTNLIGPARDFHVDSRDFGSGLVGVYTTAMVDAVRKHAFSNADYCQFIVRSTEDRKGARAAAACLIRNVLGRPTLARTSRPMLHR